MPEAEVSKSSATDQPKVILSIEYAPVSAMQRQAWRRLWLKLLAEAKDEEEKSDIESNSR
jgi:hypothetical protein